jgi:hypothetical protein
MNVCRWARGLRDGSISAIDDLESGQKYAIMQWLRGNGRNDLYNLRVTDDQIGPRREGADYGGPVASPTPPPWREVTMSAGSVGADPSNVAFINGFGAARLSGAGLTLCTSFQNTASKTAKVVHFDFILRDANGMPIATIPFDRKGTFSTGVAIRTYASFYAFGNGGADLNPRYNENCVTWPAYPLRVKSVTSNVTHVEYDDGSSWTSPVNNSIPIASAVALSSAQAVSPSVIPPNVEELAPVNGWTYYPTVSARLNQPPDGSDIEVLRGFGAVPDSGSEIAVCVAFRNIGKKVATRIDFLYTLTAADGAQLGDLTFVRSGTFSPNIAIDTFQFGTFANPRSGYYLAAHADNCTRHRTKTEPFFNPAMHVIFYRVTRVDYADGTSWPSK